MKISICMAAHNRKALLERTLQTIALSAHKDLEVICTDDASDEDERFEDLEASYPFLKVIRVDESEKWWVNPCVPYNIAFKAATGDVVIIQNPENFHVGDVIKTVADNIKPNKYLVFNCYALSKEDTGRLAGIDITQNPQTLLSLFKFNSNRGPSGWYHHHKSVPMYYHFCTAITAQDLKKIGYFDERYAFACAFDDDQLLHTIRSKGLQIVDIGDFPMVLHQWHEPFPANLSLVAINQNLYHNYTLRGR